MTKGIVCTLRLSYLFPLICLPVSSRPTAASRPPPPHSVSRREGPGPSSSSSSAPPVVASSSSAVATPASSSSLPPGASRSEGAALYADPVTRRIYWPRGVSIRTARHIDAVQRARDRHPYGLHPDDPRYHTGEDIPGMERRPTPPPREPSKLRRAAMQVSNPGPIYRRPLPSSNSGSGEESGNDSSDDSGDESDGESGDDAGPAEDPNEESEAESYHGPSFSFIHYRDSFANLFL